MIKFSNVLLSCASVAIGFSIVSAIRAFFKAEEVRIGGVNPAYYLQVAIAALLYLGAAVTKYFGY